MFDAELLARFDHVVDEVKSHDNVLTLPMRRLKELNGGLRLKALVRQSIVDHLNYKQIGVVGELPNNENESVRLYLKGTPVARIIEAVELKGSRGDKELRTLANGDAAPNVQDFIQKLKVVIEQFDQTEEGSN